MHSNNHDHTTPIFLISAPSGSGKSTVIEKVLAKNRAAVMPISHTTRAPRDYEKNGREYHFITRPEFESMIEDGSFIEWAEYSGNLYGTSLEALQVAQDEGSVLVHELDVQGVEQLQKKLPHVTAIMLVPEQPYLERIEERLRARGTESESAIQARLAKASWELDHRELFDHLVENKTGEIDAAVSEILQIIEETTQS